MSPLQEGYSSTSFLSYFLPLPSVSESQYSWSCLGGSGAQCSPFMLAAVFGFESSSPLPVCGLQEQICVQALLFGCDSSVPLALCSPCLLCAQKQLGVADKALPALRRGELICATDVFCSHLSGGHGVVFIYVTLSRIFYNNSASLIHFLPPGRRVSCLYQIPSKVCVLA